MRRIFLGLILVALLGGLVACAGGSAARTEQQTADQFLTAMAGRDFPSAYALLSADSQATVGTEEDFRTMMEAAWADAGITGFQDIKTQEAIASSGGTRASVPYSVTLTSQDSVTNPSTPVFNALSLVKEDGQWYVIWPPIR